MASQKSWKLGVFCVQLYNILAFVTAVIRQNLALLAGWPLIYTSYTLDTPMLLLYKRCGQIDIRGPLYCVLLRVCTYYHNGIMGVNEVKYTRLSSLLSLCPNLKGEGRNKGECKYI